MPRPSLIERRVSKFLREPPSIRTAASVIVTATAVVVVASGVLMRVADHREYRNIWTGMWWALQTVTTVGYGDVTPRHVSGRLIGAIVMLEGIAFLAIITAVITSSFVARAERLRNLDENKQLGAIESRLDELTHSITSIKELLSDTHAAATKQVARTTKH